MIDFGNSSERVKAITISVHPRHSTVCLDAIHSMVKLIDCKQVAIDYPGESLSSIPFQTFVIGTNRKTGTDACWEMQIINYYCLLHEGKDHLVTRIMNFMVQLNKVLERNTVVQYNTFL